MPVSFVSSTQAADQTAYNSVKKNQNQDVSMQDFFSLLSAQLANQNMMDPVSDTEFLSQMAQFSTLSATQELNSRFSNYMAISYIGKNVKATQIDENGKSQLIEGIVHKVEFVGNETFVSVDGSKIPSSAITEVSI